MGFAEIEQFAQTVFMWIGFGTVVGLAAKAIMPGPDPGGSIATLLMGIVGTVIGCSLLKFFYPTIPVTPISFLGFCVGTGGAFILLTFYKIMGGYWFIEGEQFTQKHTRRVNTSGRRVHRSHAED